MGGAVAPVSGSSSSATGVGSKVGAPFAPTATLAGSPPRLPQIAMLVDEKAVVDCKTVRLLSPLITVKSTSVIRFLNVSGSGMHASIGRLKL